MGIVRDVLSCASLAVLGAVLGPEPMTAAVVGGVMATHVAGHLGGELWQKIDRAGAAKLLRGWRGIDENHIVVQALRKAHLEALRSVLKNFRTAAKHWPELQAFADKVEAFAKIEWTEAERLTFFRYGSQTDAEYEIRRSVLNTLPRNFSAALALREQQSDEKQRAEVFEALKKGLMEGALAEIEIRTLPPGEHIPPLFRSIFLGTNLQQSWFDYFMRDAADRLKNEHAFEAIWNAEQVAYVRSLL